MAEGARLESVYAGNRIEGSNPSPSAILLENYLFFSINTDNVSKRSPTTSDNHSGMSQSAIIIL